MENMVKQRDPFWDVIKGIAVLLMLFGHSIEYGMGAEYFESKAYLENPFFQFIYGFHMPLFMFVSGYFFYRSIQKMTLRELARKLSVRVVLPILSFSLIAFLYNHTMGLISMSVVAIIKSFLVTCLSSLWFLWSYLYCSVLLGVCNKFKLDTWWVQFLIIIFLYCIPDYYNTGNFKYMYPFFLLGYYCMKFDFLSHIFRKPLHVGISSSVIYLVLMAFCFTSDTLIYTTQVFLFKGDGVFMHLYNDLLRLVVGFLGVLGFVSLTKYFFEKRSCGTFVQALSDLGIKSLGIYCFQDIVVKYIPQNTPPPTMLIENNHSVSYISCTSRY